MRYQANELRYEQVTVLEKEAIFTELRVLRDSVPKGFSCYEIRHDDECQGNPVEIAKGILVNFLWNLIGSGKSGTGGEGGTMFSRKRGLEL